MPENANDWVNLKKQAINGSVEAFEHCLELFASHSPTKPRMFIELLKVWPRHIREGNVPSVSADLKRWASSNEYKIFRIAAEIFIMSTEFIGHDSRLEMLKALWRPLQGWTYFGLHAYLEDFDFEDNIAGVQNTTRNLMSGIIALLTFPGMVESTDPLFTISPILYLPLLEAAAKVFTEPKKGSRFSIAITADIQQVLGMLPTKMSPLNVSTSDANRIADLLVPIYYQLTSVRPVQYALIRNFLDMTNRIIVCKPVVTALYERSAVLWTGRLLDLVNRNASKLSNKVDIEDAIHCWSSGWTFVIDACIPRGAPAVLEALEGRCLQSASRSQHILELESEEMGKCVHSRIANLIPEFMHWLARYTVYRSVLVRIVRAVRSVQRHPGNMEHLEKMGKKLFDIYWDREAALKDYDWQRKRTCGNPACVHSGLADYYGAWMADDAEDDEFSDTDESLTPSEEARIRDKDGADQSADEAVFEEVGPHDKVRPRLYECSGCKTRAYCSRECQSEHWQFHSIPCREPYEGPLSLDKISRLDYDFVAYLVLYALDDHADMLEETFIRKQKKQRLEVEMVNDGWPHLNLSDIPRSTLKAETAGPGNDTRFLMNIVLIPYVPSGKKITVLVGWLLVSAKQMKARESLRRITFAFERYAPSCIPVWMMSNEYPRPVFL